MPKNMKNQRNEELNFLYMNQPKPEKIKRKKRADNKKSAQEDEKFNFDNEIVIGVTVKPNGKNKKKSSIRNKKTKDKISKKRNSKKITINEQKNQNSKINKNNKVIVKRQQNNIKEVQEYYNYDEEEKVENKRTIKKIITYILLTGIFTTAMILFLLSPVFNITQIEVTNNNKISEQTYISLSEIQIGENTFKILKSKVIQNIKKEPYVEKVQVIRQLPDKIELIIEERIPTYMIQYANSYVYINNQGYILQISEEKLDVPIIKSITTSEEDIKLGERINSEDLQSLGNILKIVEAANSISIGNFITYIDVANKQDFVIRMDEKKKTIHLGDTNNLSNKLLYIKAIIEKEEGIEGEILANNLTNGVVWRYKE